ncbi:hypothetical protein KQY27_05250 [Methanobrevibacter sp. TMH8]|uniref:right-handed parallel beta-helix repeat-containing protein n=1 Tax=Methanobrevibacter sp. TMH8 TaxID=2848611 RepID=UPI001CCC4CDD|nr:right-handed parallel beta-helix repeat-containing protein [Methanobrevibacter sp. TMH8]MBZ9570947.1 hypothetical protein [Methanobrevibacter sp. TMH8]
MEILKNKFSSKMILIIFILFLLSITISTVNAAEKNITSSDNLGQTIANASNGDTINLDEGNYTNNVTGININKNLTMVGKNKETTIIDAQKIANIFTLTTGNTLTLINITLINGIRVTSGGAIETQTGTTLNINNCIFTNNRAGNAGGAIDSAGILNIANSTFNNSRADSWGGAIYQTGTNLTIINSTFTNTIGRLGGVIFNSNAKLIVINSTFTNNTGTIGGAIDTFAPNPTIVNCTFNNNTGTSGGAINNNGANPIIVNCTFNNNNATIGGAIYNNVGGVNSTISNSTFTENNATNGGAIYNIGVNCTVNNSNFTSNQASNYGGGIFNNGSMLVTGNLMADNIANVLGNEIYNNGTMGILNLTYLNNSTITVDKNSDVILYATLTDDMGNSVTGQNISFYVNGIFIGEVEAIEGNVNITYLANQSTGIIPVTGNYAGHEGFDIITKNGQLLIVANTTVNSEITLDKNEYQINETVHGKITITNTDNNTATNVTTRVLFPFGFVLNPISVVVSHGIFDPNTNIWTIGNLAPGEVATITFTGKFTTPGEHTISIETTGENFEISTDSASTFVEEEPEPPIPPKPQPEPEEQEKINENNEIATAVMKETGTPILAILIVLLSSLGLVYRKK